MIQDTLYHSLHNLAREHEELCNATVKEFGLNAAQYRVLSVIADHGPIHAANVARFIWSNDASVAHDIAHLRGRGWVIRDGAPGRGRGGPMPVMITQPGMDTLTKCTKAMDVAERHMHRFISHNTADGITAAHARMIGWYEITA